MTRTSLWLSLTVFVAACGGQSADSEGSGLRDGAGDADDDAPVGGDPAPTPSNDAPTPTNDVDVDEPAPSVDDDVSPPVEQPVAVEPGSGEPSSHRAAAEACDDVRPPGGANGTGGESDLNQCASDADCTDGANGRCDFSRGGTICTYDECFSDEDCEVGPCECGSSYGVNRCMAGDCQVDADCGEGGFCSPSMGSCGNYSGTVAYWCRTPMDTCVEDSECVDPNVGAGYCAYYPEVGYWACQYGQCVG
jgi:hypothetical protein